MDEEEQESVAERLARTLLLTREEAAAKHRRLLELQVREALLLPAHAAGGALGSRAPPLDLSPRAV